MGPLKLALLALCVAVAAPAQADPIDRWSHFIAEASARFGVPEEWIRRVMQAESGGRTHLGGRLIRSHAGAMGLMQLMPGTWGEMRARLGLGADPHEPRDNILAGTAYLRMMYDRFGYPGLFAAYNAGPRRYGQHLASGRRLPRETVAYVANVAGGRSSSSLPDPGPTPTPTPPPPVTLFAMRVVPEPGRQAIGEPPPSTGSGALFVPLSAAGPR
jgi:soluble lytic murein transglycosylase-like protein